MNVHAFPQDHLDLSLFSNVSHSPMIERFFDSTAEDCAIPH